MGEMFQTPLHLLGALNIRASHINLALQTGQRLTATRTSRWHLKCLLVTGSAFLQYLNDRWNDFTRLFDHHNVPLTNVFAPDLVAVVERCPRNRCPAHKYRVEIGHRSQFSGAAHIHLDGPHSRLSTFGLVFVRHRPTRRFRGVAKLSRRSYRSTLTTAPSISNG